jgi:S1-C subfamily serine protease
MSAILVVVAPTRRNEAMAIASEGAPTTAAVTEKSVGAASAAIGRWPSAAAPIVLALLALAAMLLASVSAQAALPEQIVRVKPSVVAVGTHQRARGPQFVFRGTGFVVGNGTLVATNAHVLPEAVDSTQLETIAILIGGERDAQVREAKIVAIDREHDLALLRITGPALPALAVGDSDRVREGESVAFTGFPIGGVMGYTPVTHQAVIAAITPVAIPSPTAQQLDPRVIRRVQAGPFSVFQLDAAAYPGNSGSPVYDVARGEVVGIVNMVFVKGTREAALSNPTGISFAIPAKYLDALLRQESGTTAK